MTDKSVNDAGGRTWRLSATLVGVVAMFFASWSVNALDIGNSRWLYFAAWLALAVGFIGIATVVFVPRSQCRRVGCHVELTADDRDDRSSCQPSLS